MEYIAIALSSVCMATAAAMHTVVVKIVVLVQTFAMIVERIGLAFIASTQP